MKSRAEDELLICCAGTRVSEGQAERIRLLAEKDIDWEYTFEAALRHGMMPLLYWHINAISPEAVPGNLMGRLRDDFYNNTASNLLLTSELLKLIKLFESDAIPVIAFKGPALAIFAYGTLSLRQAGDLDLLVRKDDVTGAREILLRQNYQPQFDLTDSQEAAYVESNCEHMFVRGDLGVMVDLHWGIVPSRFAFAPDTESFWGGLTEVSINEKPIPTVCPEDLFLLLCVHGAKHYWNRLSMICDLAEVIRAHKQMDWGRVFKQAAEGGSERMLLLGLFLAHDLLGAALPEEISARIESDPATRALARRVYKMLFEKRKHGGSFKELLFYMKAMDRPSDRVKTCLDYLRPTPLEWEALPLPRRLSFLYYLVRPARLAGKYTGRLLKRLGPGGERADG